LEIRVIGLWDVVEVKRREKNNKAFEVDEVSPASAQVCLCCGFG
jgi:hypothetical protein